MNGLEIRAATSSIIAADHRHYNLQGDPDVKSIRSILQGEYIPSEDDIRGIEQVLCSLKPNLPTALELTEVLVEELAPKRPDLAFRVFNKAIQADHFVPLSRNGADPTEAQAPVKEVWLGYFYALPLAKIAKAHPKEYRYEVARVLCIVLEERKDISKTGLDCFYKAARCLSRIKVKGLRDWIKENVGRKRYDVRDLTRIINERLEKIAGVDLIMYAQDEITKPQPIIQETSIT